MDEKYLVKQDSNYTLTDLFLLMKKVIMSDTHVATLALYSSTEEEYTDSKKYGVIKVRPFPLKESEEDYGMICYVLDDRKFTYNQILTIVYTDLAFIDNLQIDKSNPKKVKDQTLHSQMAGVVINDNPIKIDDTNNNYIILTYNGKSYKLTKYIAP